MATNLKLVFDGAIGKKVSFSFPCANPSAGSTVVKNLMQEIIFNGDIYAEVPQSMLKAEFVTNTVTPVDLS